MKNRDQLYGLIICGGQSSRMATDKCFLPYYEVPQYNYLARILTNTKQPICQEVIISCNTSQIEKIDKSYEVIVDLPKYQKIGPMAALLSTFNTYPDRDFLVIGCDYPFVNSKDIQTFLDTIKGDSIAAAFYNKEGFYEPLLAWYSRNSQKKLLGQFETGNYSLNHFLKQWEAEKYTPPDEKIMTSIDTPEEYQIALAFLSKNPKNNEYKYFD